MVTQVGCEEGMAPGGDSGEPFYVPVKNEVNVFEIAWQSQLAIMLQGPTGCGKTRLVEYMAHRLGVPLYTVACHEDITATDLIGRYLLKGSDTVWVDGPLALAVREGGICYLDEIVEARKDATVAIHPLADHRRQLFIERLGGKRIDAADGFCLVVSYNPGYQSILKDLKMSTRQRLVGIELGSPPPDLERKILVHETGASEERVNELVRLAQVIRRVEGESGLLEVASTRTLVATGRLIARGLAPREAAIAAIVLPLTDDPTLRAGLITLVDTYIGA